MARVANTATNVYSVAGSIYPVTRYRSLALSASDRTMHWDEEMK
jgi:hypothetical protein